MKKYLGILLALMTSACTGALAGGTIGGGGATTNPSPVYSFGVVACGVPVALTDPCPSPIPGAKIEVQAADGWGYKTANGDGFASMQSFLPFSAVRVSADGYVTTAVSIQPPAIHQRNISVSLAPKTPPLPAPPTRDEILNLHITFQGLMVHCAPPFGDLPWFEASLPWLPPDCRQAAYAAKLAASSWGPGGDTHALINLPSGPPLYDETGQPYSADRFGPLDWTDPADGRLADLVAEVARAGFNRQLLFLGGDDGERGFPIAMAQLDTVRQQLRASSHGDLGPYVVVLPGYDGVFYGYSPDQVAQWGAKCRQLFVYCGIEHQPGRIPVGEGGSDYLPGGRMTSFDLILAEFNGPNLTDWRTKRSLDAQGRPDYPGNQIWQIGSRMLGRAYTRPADQPADADGYSGAGYLAPGSPRGPYVHCAFEWVGEYNFVRGWETAADEQRSREYFQSAGWTCGG